jgi:antitoxin (DNA-binding transcriptional repressor) of toxin-antitoxin stability system
MAKRARTVGVRELRQNLSVHLVRVKKGEVLTVTEHGQAVAELRPLPREDQLHRLLADGRVTAARRTPVDLPRPLRLELDRPVSVLLQDLRDDSQ